MLSLPREVDEPDEPSGHHGGDRARRDELGRRFVRRGVALLELEAGAGDEAG